MVDFRYAQFCPLTRAAEILGERWTVLVLRELFTGPRRFRDLKDALPGISSSVLADRLDRLEEKAIVARRELAPPASAVLYELDEAGQALQPLLLEMTRWGMRFLGAPCSADRFRPEWMLLGLEAFARREGSDEIGARLVVEDGPESLEIYVRGGSDGTTVSASSMTWDASLKAGPLAMMMFLSGMLTVGDPEWPSIEGDVGIARRIPSLFDFRPASAPAAPPRGRTEAVARPTTRARRPTRRVPSSAARRGRQGAVAP